MVSFSCPNFQIRLPPRGPTYPRAASECLYCFAVSLNLPFALRRPWLLTRDLLRSRARPDVAGLESIDDPETFVWTILPHAARTFTACIMLLPAESARVT